MITRLIQITVFLIGLIGVVTAYRIGGKNKILKDIKKANEEAKKIRTRTFKRAHDPISVVDKRLRKNIRD